MTWQLQEAKNRLSEVVREAQTSGPQVITVRGKEAAVILSAEEYRLLAHRDEGSLVAFFQNSPWADIEVEVERVQDVGREIEL
jgi:prevent-host-death family protein